MAANSCKASRRRGAALAIGIALAALPDCPETVSNAKARSWAERNRWSGLFSRQRLTMRSRTGENPCSAFVSSGGSSFRIAFIVSMADSRRNARLPDSVS